MTPPIPSPEPPNALNSTSGSALFIALHIMKVRISPAAPTIEPAMMSTLLPMTKPVKAAAMPDRELSRLTTTGISAPPIGTTNSTPSRLAMATIPQTYSLFIGSSIVIQMKYRVPKSNSNFTAFSHGGPQVGNLTHFLLMGTTNPPLSFIIATSEPVKVTHPTSPDRPIATQTT